VKKPTCLYELCQYLMEHPNLFCRKHIYPEKLGPLTVVSVQDESFLLERDEQGNSPLNFNSPKPGEQRKIAYQEVVFEFDAAGFNYITHYGTILRYEYR
jgi:hypothetical protein